MVEKAGTGPAMSDLDRIKQAMADGEHTDGDLQWTVERISELEGFIDAWCGQPDQTKIFDHFKALQEVIEEIRALPEQWLSDCMNHKCQNTDCANDIIAALAKLDEK